MRINLPWPPSVSGVYRIVDQKTGRYYFGSSIDIRNRCYQHRQALRKGVHTNPILQSAWRVHGEECFTFEVVEACWPTKEALLGLEQRYLDKHQVGSNWLCMNVLKIAGSHLGAKRSVETCKRLSEVNSGKTLTPGHREKLSLAKIGRRWPIDDPRREKIRLRSKGQPGPVHSPEQLAKWRKLDRERVLNVRRLATQGVGTPTIARIVGCGRATVRRILKKESYKDVC